MSISCCVYIQLTTSTFTQSTNFNTPQFLKLSKGYTDVQYKVFEALVFSFSYTCSNRFSIEHLHYLGRVCSRSWRRSETRCWGNAMAGSDIGRHSGKSLESYTFCSISLWVWRNGRFLGMGRYLRGNSYVARMSIEITKWDVYKARFWESSNWQTWSSHEEFRIILNFEMT